MCEYNAEKPYYALRVPNVLNNFEATAAVIGVAVILLVVLLIRSLRLPGNDSSKPFLFMLSLVMTLAIAASIVLYLYRLCYLGRNLGHFASKIEAIGRFASVSSLLFGGGLIGASNTAPTVGNGAAWFCHIAIVTISIVTGALCQMFWSQLDYIPALIFYILPLIGFIILMVGLLVGCYRARKTASTEPTEKTPFCSLVCLFVAPVLLVVASRLLDDYDVLQRVLTTNIRGFHVRDDDRLGIDLAIIAQPVIKGVGLEQWELFLPIVVVLSALIFHPSVRCIRSSDKSKIAPTSDDVCQAPASLMSGWSMPYPMNSPAHANMMAPQMPANCTVPTINTQNAMMMPPMTTSHSMVSFPMMHSPIPAASSISTPITMPTSQPIAHAQLLPSFQQHPQVHCMGGRPLYLMA